MTALLKTGFLGVLLCGGLVAAQTPFVPHPIEDPHPPASAPNPVAKQPSTKAPGTKASAQPATNPNSAESQRAMEFVEAMQDMGRGQESPPPERQPWRNCIAPLTAALAKAPNAGGPAIGYDELAARKTPRGMQYLLQVWRQDSKFDSKFDCEVDTRGAYLNGKPTTRESF